MTLGVETRLDGETLVVRIPMRFHRRGCRKRIIAPDGDENVPTSKPQPDDTLVKALARAWRCQKLLDGGVYTSGHLDGGRGSGSGAQLKRMAAAAPIPREHSRGAPGARPGSSSSRRCSPA